MLQQNTQRTGPHPLPLYLAAAQFSRAVAGNPAKLQQMIAGIQKYQGFAQAEKREALLCLRQKGEVRLLYGAANGAEENALSVILVPSLINRAYIFDLHAQQSFVQFLRAQGVHVYLLDWGVPARDDMQQNMEALIMRRLVPALEFAKQHAAGPLHALGYCMGGTILAAAAQHFDGLEGVCFLATPWDFSKSHPELLRLIAGPFNPVQYFSEAQETMPASYLQSLFASLDPDRAVEKFIAFAQADENSVAASLFVAAEDWLNDGVDLPRDIATEAMEGWFGSNTPAAGNWSVGGKAVAPQDITTKSLVVASRKDRLISYDSAAGLAEGLPQNTLITPNCGHIGMMAGRKAKKEVWQPILQWIREDD